MKNLKEDLQAHIVSLHEVERPRQREWIWEGYIPKEHLSLIYGEGGKAKSLLALHLATSVAAEGVTTWLERGIITGGVLYVDFELSLDEQTRRAYEIASGLGLERPPKNLMLFPAGVFPRAAVFHTIRLFCEKHGIDLVIIDSLGMALEGDAESSRDVIGFFQRYITPILDTGATVLGVDHQAKRIKGDRYKDKTVFGSVYKTNLARSVIQVDGDRTEDGVNVTLQHKKANVGCEQPMLAAKVKFESGKVVVERLLFSIEEDYSPESPPTTVDQVIEVLQERGAMFSADIEEATGLEKKTVQNVLSTLRRSGRVEDTGNKKGNAREVQIVNHSQHSQPIKGMGTAGTNSLFSDDGDLALGLKQEGRVLPSDAPPGVYETIEEFRAGKPTKTTEDLAREQAARER